MIFQEGEAYSLFDNPDFLGAWDLLWEKCPWATVFQHKDFVITWYNNYLSFKPLVLSDWNGKTMSFLFTLSLKKANLISAAGFDQAEYQTWLSKPDTYENYIHQNILDLKVKFPNHRIHLKYLPSRTPLTWLRNSKTLMGCYFLKEHEQPMVLLDKVLLEGELKKKNRKEKLNRLRRLGNLQFIQISSIEEFGKVIDEMILQSDLRKGAIYGKMIFQDEPNRRNFLLKMFELGHLHVSILKLGDAIIASNAGFMGKDVVHLQGINSHSPFFSKYSPGILHFLMLGIHLSEVEKKYFDLTPGGIDGYKSMLANTTETVHELWISNQRDIFPLLVKENLKKWVLTLSEESGFISAAVSAYRDKFKGRKSGINWKRIFPKNGSCLNELDSRGDKIYFILDSLLESPDLKSGSISVRKNLIADLFLLEESGKKFSKRDFFSDSLRRIELGNQLISVIWEGKLLAAFWDISESRKLNDKFPSNGNTQKKIIICCSYFDCRISNQLMPKIHQLILELFVGVKDNNQVILEVGHKQRQLIRLLSNWNVKPFYI